MIITLELENRWGGEEHHCKGNETQNNLYSFEYLLPQY